MTIPKQEILELVQELPDEVDVDEVIYRLYLRQKLEAAEGDIREGRLISHDEVARETAQWFAE